MSWNVRVRAGHSGRLVPGDPPLCRGTGLGRGTSVWTPGDSPSFYWKFAGDL